MHRNITYNIHSFVTERKTRKYLSFIQLMFFLQIHLDSRCIVRCNPIYWQTVVKGMLPYSWMYGIQCLNFIECRRGAVYRRYSRIWIHIFLSSKLVTSLLKRKGGSFKKKPFLTTWFSFICFKCLISSCRKFHPICSQFCQCKR